LLQSQPRRRAQRRHLHDADALASQHPEIVSGPRCAICRELHPSPYYEELCSEAWRRKHADYFVQPDAELCSPAQPNAPPNPDPGTGKGDGQIMAAVTSKTPALDCSTRLAPSSSKPPTPHKRNPHASRNSGNPARRRQRPDHSRCNSSSSSAALTHSRKPQQSFCPPPRKSPQAQKPSRRNPARREQASGAARNRARS